MFNNIKTSVLLTVTACNSNEPKAESAATTDGMAIVENIMPQLFIPMATLYSRPENKTRNMGYVASGLLTGILSARAVSGYVGEWWGWRSMFFIVAGLMLVGLVVTLRMMQKDWPKLMCSHRADTVRRRCLSWLSTRTTCLLTPAKSMLMRNDSMFNRQS